MLKLMPLILLALTSASQRSDITGNVRLSSGTTAKAAVVFLEGSIRPKPLKHAVIDQRDKAFEPHILVVPVGTTVEFPNHDVVFHNVFAEYNAKRFDLGMYPRGAKRSQRFDKPGLVALFCSIHSDMSAYIMVVDTPYYAITDRFGNFKISGVQPGHYKVRVWHESGEIDEQEASIVGHDRLDLTTHRK